MFQPYDHLSLIFPGLSSNTLTVSVSKRTKNRAVNDRSGLWRSGSDAFHKRTHFINVFDRTRLRDDSLLLLLAQRIKPVSGRSVPIQLRQKILGGVWDIPHDYHLSDSMSPTGAQ